VCTRTPRGSTASPPTAAPCLTVGTSFASRPWPHAVSYLSAYSVPAHTHLVLFPGLTRPPKGSLIVHPYTLLPCLVFRPSHLALLSMCAPYVMA